MPRSIHEMSTWGATGAAPLDSSRGASTVLLEDLERWPASPSDVGRRVGERLWDMSVVCGPAEAMRLQFDVLQPAFVAVHDVGGAISRRLLAGVAAAMQTAVHTLRIRRQGYGNTLATIEFIELPMHDSRTRTSRPLRIYTTHVVDVDDPTRKSIADVLLGRSTLAVTIVAPDANEGSLAMSLAGLQDAMQRPGWTNRHTLLLPLRPLAALKAQAARLGMGREITVHVAPTVLRPVEAWNHIRSQWNSLADLGEANMLPIDDPTSPGARPRSWQSAPSAAESAAARAQAVEELRRRLSSPPPAEAIAPTHDAPNAPHHAPPAQDAAPSAASTTGGAFMGRMAAEQLRQQAPRATVASGSFLDESLVMPGRKAMPPADSPEIRPTPTSLVAEGMATNTSPAPTCEALDTLRRFVGACASGLIGLQRCAVVDISARTVLAQHGFDEPAVCASNGTRLVNALKAAALGFAVPGRIPDAALTYDDHHLLVRPMPGHDAQAFVAVLDRESANVVVVRHKLQRLERAYFPAAHEGRTAATVPSDLDASPSTQMPPMF